MAIYSDMSKHTTRETEAAVCFAPVNGGAWVGADPHPALGRGTKNASNHDVFENTSRPTQSQHAGVSDTVYFWSLRIQPVTAERQLPRAPVDDGLGSVLPKVPSTAEYTPAPANGVHPCVQVREVSRVTCEDISDSGSTRNICISS